MQLKRLLAGVCFALGGCGPEAGPDLSKHWVVGEYSDLDGTSREPADILTVVRYTFREDGIVDVESDSSCGRSDEASKRQFAWEPAGEDAVTMEWADPGPPPIPGTTLHYKVFRDVDWEGAAITQVAKSGPCQALGLHRTEVEGSLLDVIYHGHVCPEHRTEPCEIAGEPETCESCLRNHWCDGEPPPCLSE